MIINKCVDCAHSNVCIYKQRYQKIYTLLEIESKYDKPFSVELNCEEYEPRNYSLRDIKFNTNDLLYNIIKTSDSCKGCSTYEDIQKGKTVVNAPCTFCNKYPLKVTC